MKRQIRGIDDNRILTPTQKAFIREFAKSELRDIFRLTGGTALSAFYLEHRLSEDLDFFSSERIPFYVSENFFKSLNIIDDIAYTPLYFSYEISISKWTGRIRCFERVLYPALYPSYRL